MPAPAKSPRHHKKVNNSKEQTQSPSLPPSGKPQATTLHFLISLSCIAQSHLGQHSVKPSQPLYLAHQAIHLRTKFNTTSMHFSRLKARHRSRRRWGTAGDFTPNSPRAGNIENFHPPQRKIRVFRILALLGLIESLVCLNNPIRAFPTHPGQTRPLDRLRFLPMFIVIGHIECSFCVLSLEM